MVRNFSAIRHTQSGHGDTFVRESVETQLRRTLGNIDVNPVMALVRLAHLPDRA
jgi:hypothetical protein